MEKLISRWNREKAQALEKERVFNVEERDECLILTKKPPPRLETVFASVTLALLWMLVNWQIFQSPVNRATWVGWVILWILIGPAIAVVHIGNAWQVRQGEIWIFNRNTGRLEHNDSSVASFEQIKSISAVKSGATPGGSCSSLLIKYQSTKIVAKVVILDGGGRHEEHLRLGRQIADFVGVCFNPPGNPW